MLTKGGQLDQVGLLVVCNIQQKYVQSFMFSAACMMSLVFVSVVIIIYNYVLMCHYFTLTWIRENVLMCGSNLRQEAQTEPHVTVSFGGKRRSERVYCHYQVLAAGVSLPTCKDLTRWKDLAWRPAAHSFSSSSLTSSPAAAALPVMMNARTVAEMTIIETNHLVRPAIRYHFAKGFLSVDESLIINSLGLFLLYAQQNSSTPLVH